MRRFLKRLHGAWYVGSVVFFFALFYPFLYYFSRNQDRYLILNKFRRVFAFCSSAGAGLFYRYTYQERPEPGKTYIICANHTSNLDISAVALLTRGNFAFLGKDELLNNPVTGLFFRTIDIPLNRDSKISSFRAFKRAEEYLKAGISVVIFPEGKIPDEYPPVLSAFRNGPFRLATELQIPILPVTIADAWKRMWDDGRQHGSSPGISHICVHAPIDTRGMTAADADTLLERVRSVIEGGFQVQHT
jgi:1-acyl-sn-glycerol-3-phosphate acyltransferase